MPCIPFGQLGTDGKNIYVFGGRTADTNEPVNGIPTVQIWDSATDTWEFGPPMTLARSGMGTAPFLNGKFYVLGGEELVRTFSTGRRVFPQVHLFNTATKLWEIGPHMPRGAHGVYPVADVARGKIYVAGGGLSVGNAVSQQFQILTVQSPAVADEQDDPERNVKVCTVVRHQDTPSILDCGVTGVVIKIDFAVKGYPYGACGSYGVDPNDFCSKDVTAQLTALCMGKQKCAIDMKQFASPCQYRSGHSLAVQATCEIPKEAIVEFTHIGKGCCRTAEGDAGDYTKYNRISLVECKAKCIEDENCLGIEHNEKSCEIHFEALSYVKSPCPYMCLAATRTMIAQTAGFDQCGGYHSPVFENALLEHQFFAAMSRHDDTERQNSVESENGDTSIRAGAVVAMCTSIALVLALVLVAASCARSPRTTAASGSEWHTFVAHEHATAWSLANVEQKQAVHARTIASLMTVLDGPIASLTTVIDGPIADVRGGVEWTDADRQTTSSSHTVLVI